MVERKPWNDIKCLSRYARLVDVGLCTQIVTMKTLIFSTTLLFNPFLAWAQVQSPSLTLPYDTTQDRANVVKIFTDSYSAYRFVSSRVGLGPPIDLVTRALAGLTRLSTMKSHH